MFITSPFRQRLPFRNYYARIIYISFKRRVRLGSRSIKRQAGQKAQDLWTEAAGTLIGLRPYVWSCWLFITTSPSNQVKRPSYELSSPNKLVHVLSYSACWLLTYPPHSGLQGGFRLVSSQPFWCMERVEAPSTNLGFIDKPCKFYFLYQKTAKMVLLKMLF